ncbi:MAG: serine hydrolase [Tahibacter sp.]
MRNTVLHRYGFIVGLLIAAAMAVLPTSATAQVASAYDQAFDDVMQRYQLPGLVLGVIEDGEVSYVRVAGERVAGSGKKIDSATLFKIASNSKAMTASLLARLVDAGKLRWDDPVVQHLPQFRMYDEWVTQHMRVSDLLVHNSGLPEGAGDLMLWPEPNDYTRSDIIHGLSYLKPAYGFRAGYAYDNLLYVVAGEVAAAAGGKSYETLLRSEVFEPLKLHCRVGAWRRDDVDNVAQPHMRKGDRNVLIRADAAQVPVITSAAAGGIRCSLDDMLQWARNWLAPDTQQQAWLSSEQRTAVWTPRTPMPISARRREWDNSHFYAYGFGWRLADVDGVWTVSHTGTLAGMYSVLTLLPDRRSGFVMLTNGEGSEARTALTEVLLKHFTAPALNQRIADYAEPRSTATSPTPPAASTPAVPRERASARQMREWLGRWRDPWFGDISVCARGKAVRFVATKSPMLAGTVLRVGERYLVDWDDDSVDAEAWLDFSAATDGGPMKLRMSKVDPAADFSFDYEDLAFVREQSCDRG